MLFINETQKIEQYELCDVFGRDKIFYKNSTVRIAGWETPISVIYRDGKEIKIRFKRDIEDYSKDYVDKPFNSDIVTPESIFYDVMLKNYLDEMHLRRLNYAVEQYKNTNRHSFSRTRLFPKDLQDKLQSNELQEEIYVLNDNYSLFDSSCFWFPIDFDAIIIDFSNCETISRSEAVLSFANGKFRYGHVGFDGNFYAFDGTCCMKPCEVYNLDSGIRKIDPPSWLKEPPQFGYCFLKEYVITPDNTCYNYTGVFLENKTKHHKNVKLMNDLIALLRKNQIETYSDKPFTKLAVSRDYLEFDVHDVERIIVPHLSSKNMLNQKSYDRFKAISKIIEKANLQLDFETALRNILDLNKSAIYGGSKRNVCGEKLLLNLQKLCKKMSPEKLSAMLNDEITLKIEVAKTNGTMVDECVVSASDYSLIKNDRKVPKALRANAQWTKIKPGTLVVFTCESNERFCVIKTQTKKGYGLNRA